MRKPFSIIYLVFHLALFFGAIYVNYRSDDFGYLLWLRERIPQMIYLSAAGILLYFVGIVISFFEQRSHEHEKDSLRQEINALKAKMFDLSDIKESPAAKAPDDSEKDSKPKQEHAPKEEKS